MYTASLMLKLASDPTRLKILWALLHGEHSVNELAEHVGAKPGAVSQHLGKLRMAQIVEVNRDGNRMYYKIDNKYLKTAIEAALRYANIEIKRPRN
ncbi:MAG: ArsR/SmtB family transcription factor [Minisyncoccota bacterium]